MCDAADTLIRPSHTVLGLVWSSQNSNRDLRANFAPIRLMLVWFRGGIGLIEPDPRSWVLCSDDNESHRLAVLEAERVSGRTLPGLALVQSGRLAIAAVLTLAELRKLVAQLRPTGPSRPTVAGHVSDIADYLVANPDSYVLPPVTIGLLPGPSFYSVSERSSAFGWLVIPPDTRFHIIDGQHRLQVLMGTKSGRRTTAKLHSIALAIRDEDAIGLMIVLERSADDLDQHFADASHSAPLGAGQLVLYEFHDATNRVVRDLVAGSDFLRGRVDGTVTRMPAYSQNLFTAAAVRGMVTAFADGAGWSDLTPTTEILVAEFLLASLDLLAIEMVPWSEITASHGNRVGPQRMADLRTEYLCMHGVGIWLIGKSLGQVATRGTDGVRQRAAQLVAVDWRRRADPWQGLWGLPGGGITTSKEQLQTAWRLLEDQLS